MRLLLGCQCTFSNLCSMFYGLRNWKIISSNFLSSVKSNHQRQLQFSLVYTTSSDAACAIFFQGTYFFRDDQSFIGLVLFYCFRNSFFTFSNIQFLLMPCLGFCSCFWKHFGGETLGCWLPYLWPFVWQTCLALVVDFSWHT